MSGARRLLPEAAYDFWAYDCRDGEKRPKRDTFAEALAEVKHWRKALDSWKRSCIYVDWKINEKKVLRLLAESNGGKQR